MQNIKFELFEVKYPTVGSIMLNNIKLMHNKFLVLLIFSAFTFLNGAYSQEKLDGVYWYDHPEEGPDFWGVLPDRVSERLEFLPDGSFKYDIYVGYGYDTCGLGNYKLFDKNTLILEYNKIPLYIDGQMPGYKITDSSETAYDTITIHLKVFDKYSYIEKLKDSVLNRYLLIVYNDKGTLLFYRDVRSDSATIFRYFSASNTLTFEVSVLGYGKKTITIFAGKYDKSIEVYLPDRNYYSIYPPGTVKAYSIDKITSKGFYFSKDGGRNWMYFKKL